MLRGLLNAFFPTVRPPWPVPFNDICIDNKDLFSLKPQLDLFVLQTTLPNTVQVRLSL